MFKKTILINYLHATCGHFIQTLLYQLSTQNPNQIVKFKDNGTAADSIDLWSIKTNICVHSNHNAPDWEEMFKENPGAINIIIQVDERTILRMWANSHYKQLEHEFYQKLLLNSGFDFKNMDHEAYVRQKTYFYFSGSHNTVIFPFRYGDVVPKQYSDRVHVISLYDIIHNKDLVISTLEKIVGVIALPVLYETYAIYLENQKKLIPWLDEK